MLEYFGGVPKILVPDQLRSAVTGPDRYDPEISATYAEMARHYGVAIPPDDKSERTSERKLAVRHGRVLSSPRDRDGRLLQDPNEGTVVKVVRVQNFLVESDDLPVVPPGLTETGGDVRVGGLEDAAAKVNDARETIASVCTYVRDAFAKSHQPDELKLTFGLALGGEVGIPYVTKGTAKATIEIEATWKKGDAPKKSAP